MEAWRIALVVLLVIISVVITIIILFQEGKSAGLGSLSGQATDNSYWSKNKGRSQEGRMVKITTILVIAFFVLAAVLNIGVN